MAVRSYLHGLALGLAAVGVMEAQSALSVAAGTATPVGPKASAYRGGAHGRMAWDGKVPVGPFGMRIETTFSQMAGADSTNQGRRVLAGLFGVTWSGESVYALAGIGAYRWQCWGGGCAAGASAAHDMGLNAGLAYVFPIGDFAAVVEARVHILVNNTERLAFVPLTLGIAF